MKQRAGEQAAELTKAEGRRQLNLAISLGVATAFAIALTSFFRQRQKTRVLAALNVEIERQRRALEDEIGERKRAEIEANRANAALVEASRRAGQAEVAINVIHTIGNALNSVSVAGAVVAQITRESRVKNLGLAVKLLQENREILGPFFDSHPKGRLVLGYLSEISKQAEHERARTLHELAALENSLEQIKHVVASQEEYADHVAVREMLPLATLVDQAVDLVKRELGPSSIRFTSRYESLPPQWLDRHQIVQIVVSLVRHARDRALQVVAPLEGEIEISVRRAGPNRVAIDVCDNGPAPSPEELSRVFQYGGLDGAGGAQGFALHAGALAAKQMGGSLGAENAGSGRGTLLRLELPIETGVERSEVAPGVLSR